VIRDVVVFDPARGEVRAGCHLTIEAGLIREVSTVAHRRSDALVLDGAGRTVIPGLIDAHVHAIAPTTDLAAIATLVPATVEEHAMAALADMLARGFTTVRDAGGADRRIVAAARGSGRPLPRVLVSGRALAEPGGQGDFRARTATLGGPVGGGWSVTEVVEGVDAVRRSVRDQLDDGADQIKIMAGGGVSGGVPVELSHFTEAELAAAVAEADGRGSYVMAHAYAPETIRRCVEAGVRTIEHGNLIDEATARGIAGRAFVVPTLAVYAAYLEHAVELALAADLIAELDRLLQAGLRSLDICARAGVAVVFGTDLEGVLQSHQLEEFSLRARVSPPAEILASATCVNAELLGYAGRLGTMAPGAIADLVVVGGDPLDDIQVLAAGDAVAAVVVAGRLHHDRIGR
jgi:imidazolonepropionase-like amidohydrolase